MRSILELFLFFLVLMGLPDWYIYRMHVRHWTSKLARYIYWIPSLLLLIGLAYTFGTYEPRPIPMNRLSVFLAFFLCICVPKAIFVLLAIPLKKLRYGKYLAGGIAIASMTYLIYGATEGIQHFQVKDIHVHSEDLPKGFEGYRIVHIADIHAGSWRGNTAPLQKAVNLINAQHPDLIVFTGDLVNNVASELDEYMPVLSQLKAKQGVYSVLGNHDYSMYIKWKNKADQQADVESLKEKQAQMGWQLLNNRHVKLHQNGDSIALIGVENSGRPPFPDLAKLDEASTGTEGMFSILLSHDPSHWRREVLPQTDIQLTLSGHTHAMQTKIFGFSPARVAYPENEGLYEENGQMLYVNIGLGHLLFPLRMGAWPEITLITLNNKKT